MTISPPWRRKPRPHAKSRPAESVLRTSHSLVACAYAIRLRLRYPRLLPPALRRSCKTRSLRCRRRPRSSLGRHHPADRSRNPHAIHDVRPRIIWNVSRLPSPTVHLRLRGGSCPHLTHGRELFPGAYDCRWKDVSQKLLLQVMHFRALLRQRSSCLPPGLASYLIEICCPNVLDLARTSSFSSIL